MPLKSQAQERLMQAVRHNPEFAKKVGIKQSVAEKFVGPKAHSQGGALKESEMAESKKMIGKELAFMKKKGAPKEMIKHEKKEAKGKGYTKGGGVEARGKGPAKQVKMMRGGSCG